MYGLPKNFDASFFIDKRLEMICFNANQLYLHFNDGIVVTIESDFWYQPSSSKGELVSVPVLQSDMMKLLEHQVSKAVADNNGTLVITFDNGCVLKCLDNSSNYECYQIKIGNRVIIV